MLKRLMASVREFKRPTILTLIFIVGEAIIEVFIPVSYTHLSEADRLRYELARFHYGDSRDAGDSERLRKLGLLVYIDLADLDIGVFLRDLVDYRREHTAGTAPGREEVDEHRLCGIHYLGIEAVFG